MNKMAYKSLKITSGKPGNFTRREAIQNVKEQYRNGDIDREEASEHIDRIEENHRGTFKIIP